LGSEYKLNGEVYRTTYRDERIGTIEKEGSEN